MTSAAHLAYWLGPWTSPDRAPRVESRALTLWPDAPDSRLYLPRGRARGAWLVSPGAHWLGPGDPRLDRLGRILASNGHFVLSPGIPDLMDLRLTVGAIKGLVVAHDALIAETGFRPAILGLSVGSLAALRLAAGRPVASLFLFGGFADPHALFRSLTLDPRDPLNQPVVFLTLATHLPIDAMHREAVCRAWRLQIRRTWPRPEWKVPGGTGHHATAFEIAATLPEPARNAFLIGCGIRPGGWDLCAGLLDLKEFEYLDPRPWMGAVRCPVHIVHGVDDPVIPFEQQGAIAQALPRDLAVHLYSTRVYRHSTAANDPGLGWRVLREAGVLARLLHTLATSPQGGAP